MSSLPPPRFEGTISLPDRRQLGYAEFGPASGRPLVWFHGTPGARRQIAPEARRAALDRGVRIISVERPGVGSSTPHLYRAIRDFSVDVRILCDALDVDRFAVAGLSGGGPYALACAHQLPERVVTAALLGGVAPAVGEDRIRGGPSELTRALGPLVARTHDLSGRLMKQLVRALEPYTEQAIDAFAAFMPPGDQRLFAQRELRDMFADDLISASRDHMKAFLFDTVLFGRDWGFRLSEIGQPVHMWYGDADNIVPLRHGEHMANRLPNAVFRVRPEEGHLGGLGATQEIFDAVFKEWEQQPTAQRAGDG